jgi:hypothetical protein
MRNSDSAGPCGSAIRDGREGQGCFGEEGRGSDRKGCQGLLGVGNELSLCLSRVVWKHTLWQF